MRQGMRRTVLIGLVVLVAVWLAPASGAKATPSFTPPGHVPPGQEKCATSAPIRFEWFKGYDDPSTPDALDRVGALEVGSPSARNVLVLNPGTSSGAAYFVPLAQDIVRLTNGQWQVWSVERRENQLEDQSEADLAKQGKVSLQQLFDYYLGWLTNPSVTNHLQLIPDADVAYAKNWGMKVEIEDLHNVVEAAKARGNNVVMGGHSLGGSITTAYATWDFNGKPGAKDLSGLVFIDGGSGPTGISAGDAATALQNLQNGSPWLAFGGIPSPFVGIFGAGGGLNAVLEPNAPAIAQNFSLLPPSLVPPVPVTNEAIFGYGVDTETSPSNLIAAQVHAGHLAASGTPRGWDRAGEITPIQRYATMLSGAGVLGHDGTAWYHPMRLTIDSGAVAAGNPNPAQAVLDVDAIHGSDLDKHLKIYAFGAALGGQRVLDAASALAAQSHIPASNVTLVNRASTYSHNDPNAASPVNDFVANLIPFLEGAERPPGC
jgi:hypothetical protein